MRYIIILFLLISVCFGQSWQPINGKQRFTTGLGVPSKDTSTSSTADTSMITIRPQDSALWVKYKGGWYKVPRVTAANPNAILNGGNSFGSTIIIGSNDFKNVQINRGGTQALLIDTFGLTNTAGNFRVNTQNGDATFYDFGASHTQQLPSDTPILTPPILYTNLLAYKNGTLYMKDTAASHSWNYGRLAYYRDLTGYGNTYSQGVTPSSSKVSIPFYNSTHSISYTNNAVMDSVTGVIYVNNKRLADTTQLLTVGSNITNTSGTISINNSNVVAALGYMPYNASNPSSYIAKSALSATNNSSTSIFSYNSTTGAYNFDSTRFAGNDLVYNAGLLSADTSSGATKLATQGYVSRNSISLSANNTFTGSNIFKNSAGQFITSDTSTTASPTLTLNRTNYKTANIIATAGTAAAYLYSAATNDMIIASDSGKNINIGVRNTSTSYPAIYINKGGNSVGINCTAPQASLHVASAPALSSCTLTGDEVLVLQRTNASNSNVGLSLVAGNTGMSVIRFTNTGASFKGSLAYSNNTNQYDIYANGNDVVQIGSTGNITAPQFNSNATVTDLTTGSNTITAGHIYFSMPFQGSVTNGGYKKVMIYLNGLSNTTTTITYASSGGIAFTNTPYVYGTTGAVALVTATSTTVTIAAATTATGYIFLEGN